MAFTRAPTIRESRVTQLYFNNSGNITQTLLKELGAISNKTSLDMFASRTAGELEDAPVSLFCRVNDGADPLRHNPRSAASQAREQQTQKQKQQKYKCIKT